MPFDYQPIKLSEPRPTDYPQHLISTNPRRNETLSRIYSRLERILINTGDLEIYEMTYKTPIQTEHPENNIGRVRYFKSSGNSAVIVLPKRGTYGYDPAPLIAAYLAENGVSAYLVETPYHGSRRINALKGGMPVELDKLKIAFQQAITETMGLVDSVEERNVGICGVSLGAIYASIIYGADPRFSSACLVGAGGDIANLIFKTKDGFFKYLREEHLIKRGISEEELRLQLEEFEPTRHADRSRRDGLFMVYPIFDTHLPFRNAEDLRESWNFPKRMLVPLPHNAMVLYAPFLLPMILNHFKATLDS